MYNCTCSRFYIYFCLSVSPLQTAMGTPTVSSRTVMCRMSQSSTLTLSRKHRSTTTDRYDLHVGWDYVGCFRGDPQSLRKTLFIFFVCECVLIEPLLYQLLVHIPISCNAARLGAVAMVILKNTLSAMPDGALQTSL